MQTAEANLSHDAEVVAIAPQVKQMTEYAEVRITTPAEFTQAGAWLKTIKGLLNKIETARTRITQPMNQALRAVNEQAREQSAPLLTAETKLKRSMGAYTTEQDRLRREEQRKADEAARKQQEQLQAKAVAAAAKGKIERAEQLAHQAASVVAPVIQREAPKVAGITTREVWKFEVTDPSLVPREYLSVDETKIRRVVQALKGDMQIPGVRIYSDTQIAAGRDDRPASAAALGL
jgi:prophage DNA circulation protein